MAITLRQESNAQAVTKGSALTFAELDNNFIHILDNGIIVVGDDSTGTEFTLGNTLKVAGGTGITTAISGNTLTITNTVSDTGILNVVEDTTPQLGGNLDINAKKIVSTSNGTIELEPNGTGVVLADVTGGGTLKIENTHTYTSGFDNIYPGTALTLSDSGGATITVDQYLQESPAPAGQWFSIYYDNTGTYTYPSGATAGDVASFLGYNFNDQVCDWTAQGGDLYISALNHTDYTDANIYLSTPLAGYKEAVDTLTDDSTTDIHINCANRTVSTFSLNDNKTFVFTNLDVGRSHTLIITNQGSHTATLQGSDSSAIKFPGGAPTITTGAGSIDVITVFYDGVNYLGNIVQDYQ